MLSKEIQRFIFEIKEMNAIGCILVPEKSLPGLIETLHQADVIVGRKEQKGRVTYRPVTRADNLDLIDAPAILIAVEEEYSGDKGFQERLLKRASYFLNVG